MENKETKKVDACCKCCPEGCTCGDCVCCKGGVTTQNTSCCGSSCVPQGCPCCSRMRSCCRLCKLGKLLFWVLVILALWHVAFGGGMRRMGGMGMGDSCGCGMNGGVAMSGQMNCMGMKGMKDDKGERKGWFNRGRIDGDDKVVSGSVMSGDMK